MLVPKIEKKFLILFFVSLSHIGFSQTAKINGVVKNATNGTLHISRPAYPFSRNNVYLGYQKIVLNNEGAFNLSIDLHEPEIINASFEDSRGRQLAYYNFYLSPGDNLKMESGEEMVKNYFKVTGKGSHNNQLLAIESNDSIQKFYRDTLPERLISYLESENQLHKNILAEYISKYHPTTDFTAAWKINLQYEVLDAYYAFATNHSGEEPYERNSAKWNMIKESLFIKAPVMNEKALVSPTYKNLLSTYLLRTRENLCVQFKTNRADFLLEWYGKDTAAGAELFMADKHNDLQQRIIEKNFTGKLKEYLYVLLIYDALGNSRIENLNEVYQNYKLQFPSSNYLELFEERMNEIASRQQLKLTSAMTFIDNDRLKSWEDVLAYFKGKTVLLDMWGTWCGPCRRDMDRHSAFIKKHFKDKPLDYFYIANDDTGHEKIWRELIAYFNLSGYHAMANEALTKDIMEKIKGEGYPAYVIILKDGTFERHKRGMGLDRDALIAQLEEILVRK